MTVNAWVRPAAYGGMAGLLLLVLYFVILSLVSGWQFTLAQFAEFRYFILTLVTGFGVQVALYVRLRHVARHGGAGRAVAVSGGTSTAAMISCCTHYLANILPVLGATGVVALVAQYQTELFWLGVLFNLAGVAYIGRTLLVATRHLSSMTRTA